MKKVILFVLGLIMSSATFAQREETIIGDSGWGFSGAWGGWSYNMGSFNKDFTGYNGTLWYLEFGKKLQVGSWHYSLNNVPLNDTLGFSMRSNSLRLGFTPRAYRPVHPIFSLALGSTNLRQTRAGNDLAEDRVFTVHPMAGIEANLTRWCHLDVQLGYRFVAGSNFKGYKDDDFSGLFGSVNLKFGFSWGRYKDRNYQKKRNRDRDDD